MRRRVLGITAVGLLAVLSITTLLNQTPERLYKPDAKEIRNNEALGGQNYLTTMMANEITGKIDPSDVEAAKQQVEALSQLNKTSTLNLMWEFAGPDDIGGRTRGFILDVDNSNIIYAAGVAGGIFKSTNAGLSWVAISDDLNNIKVASLTQTANGDIYAGTGETNIFFGNGGGSSATPIFVGSGVYKSTDDGATWTLLSSTTGSGWGGVSELLADPVDSNRIYAATNGGVRRSDDGGQTWKTPTGLPSSTSVDMAMGPDGSVWADVGDATWYSPNGNDNSWTQISASGSFPQPDDLPSNGGRQVYAVSPQNADIVYVVQALGFSSGTRAVYRTLDRGQTWSVIGSPTNLFDPLCAGVGLNQNGDPTKRCQTTWDMLLQVNPKDADHIFVGGIEMWEWKFTTGWRKVDTQFPSPFQIHSDKHRMRFDPNNPDIVYVGSDGGIAKSSDNGFTWADFSKNYTTTQFYQMNIGHDRTMVGGMQDNGSIAIDGTGNTPQNSRQLGFVFSSDPAIDPFAGDGGYNLISWLDDDIYFGSYQRGNMGRSENKGENFTTFWGNVTSRVGATPGQGFSNWIVPFHLYETTTDVLSQDSVWFTARPAIMSLGFGGGDTTFSNTLMKQQESADFVTESFRIESGSLVITSDAQGNLSGDGSGTFDPSTGNYTVTFSSIPVAEIIVTCNHRYTAGSVIKVNSNTNGLPYNYTVSQVLQPNDSIQIQDPVQSVFTIGLNGSVWMTRQSLDFSEPNPEWYKVADIAGSAQSITMSADGDVIWVGTTGGRVYRITNINLARTPETGDIDEPNPEVEFAQVASFGSRNITGIAVDPNDNENVVITVGNYGNSSYVYYSTNAMSATPTFASKQGNLPAAPVYCASFDKGNPGYVLVGTEFGMYATDNITAPSVSWTEENMGMPRVPVLSIVQYRTEASSTPDSDVKEGDFFIGTHGRGIYKTNTLQTTRPISIPEEEPLAFERAQKQLQMFPNPAVDHTTVEFNLMKREDVTIFVRDMNGRLVNQLRFNKMAPGKREVRINTSDLAPGTYLLSVQHGEDLQSGKFVVNR